MSETSEQNVIRKTITVHCSPATAFHLWTEKISLWWPKNHSISGNLETAVFIEGAVGGRIYEETPDGIAYVWGEVVVWEPPYHFAYNWYLGSDSQRPTRVEIRFTAQGENDTRVDVFHRGPDLIGALWHGRKSAFNHAWQEVLLRYIQAFDENS